MSNNERLSWYHSPLEKELLKRLTERSDLHGFAQILTQLFITALLGAGAYFSFKHLPLWLSIPVFFIYATFYSFLGLSGAGHELSHRTVFKSKFWNELFIRIVSFLSWTNFVYFRASHARHHQYTVNKGLDLEVVLPLKVSAKDWFLLFTFDFRRLYYDFKNNVRHCFGIVKGEWEERIFPETNIKERRQLFRWARIMLFGHLALAVLFILSGQWVLLLLVTFTIYFTQWLNFLCGFTQHAGLQPNVSDFRLCCRSVKLNPVFAFFYWQMNYHIEHHMYAGVPFYNLKNLRKSIEHDLPPASKGLLPAWKEILSILAKQAKHPEYFHVQSIPKNNTEIKKPVFN